VGECEPPSTCGLDVSSLDLRRYPEVGSYSAVEAGPILSLADDGFALLGTSAGRASYGQMPGGGDRLT
jgi:hypothetical protein